MPGRAYFVSFLCTLWIAGAASAQTVLLGEGPLVDRCWRVKLTLDLKGKLTFQNQGKTETVDHDASAQHDFLERVLGAHDGIAERTARVYEVAKATIAGQTRVLRAERSFMVAHRLKDQLITYSVKGPLYVEEMELTEHFDTLALPGLLPNKQVKVGASWSVPPAIIQALCGLDALDAQVKQELTGTLQAVEGNRARIAIQGTIKGIQLGAPVAIHIDAKTSLVFDIEKQCIVELDWRQSDQRQQGPATPNLSADVSIKLTRTPIAEPAELNKLALVPLPEGAPPAKLTNLEQRVESGDSKKEFTFQHSREWQFVGERNGQRILKLVTGRGDWVADAIVMPWSGPQVKDAQTFKQLMEEAPGWQQDEAPQLDDAVKHPRSYTVYRVAASGKLEGVAAFRTCYLLGSASGQQVLVTFIVPPGQVSNLGNRDQTLVEGVELK